VVDGMPDKISPIANKRINGIALDKKDRDIFETF
jgi:hypothetical protein